MKPETTRAENGTFTANLVDYDIVKWHFYAAIACIFITLLSGLSYSLQFLQKYPFPGVELLSPGRVRMVHTMSLAYGWLANGLFAIIYYIVPKLTGFQVLSRRL